MNIRIALVTLGLSLGLMAGGPGCGGDDNPPAPPVPMGGTEDPPMTSGADTMTGSSTSGTADSTGEPLLNCDQIQCIGNGSCEFDPVGGAYCLCDPGYVIDEDGDECLIDRSCVRLRYLEDRCRQIFNGAPAVSLFFAIDFCAGTAVTPQWVETLGLEFTVLENGVDIAKNVESEASFIDKDVESYVTLVLDMSGSVADGADLPTLIAALRNMVAELEPAPGEPPVAVSVSVFGRFVEEWLPFTRDFAAVDAALAQIEADPPAVTALVNPDGTSLYEAVAYGINRTQRIRDLRAAVTWDGVLSTGTVVVVTDGIDTSNGQLDQGLVAETLNQVISIGISNAVEDEDLAAIGRDGSNLAPEPDNWVAAFAEVAARVQEYPDRAYLLAYCSSATQGDPEVTVTASGPGIRVGNTPTCRFTADAFGTDPGLTCSAELFAQECDARQCGGLTACGACADDECCTGSLCAAPVVIDSGGLSCEMVDQFCAATNQICVAGEGQDPDTCEDPDIIGGACDPGCAPGQSWCLEPEGGGDGTCTAALALGMSCDEGQQCQSLNCHPTNPDNPLELPTCQPAAQLYDHCQSPAETTCEAGAFCQGGECTPQERHLETCSGAIQCRSGYCDRPVDTNVCVASAMCYWPWSDKMPS